MNNTPSRHQNLPLFNPHRADFTCVHEATQVPPIDPQAETWLQEGLALESPDIWREDRNYQKVAQLYTQAAERGHWKAMMNLISLQIEGSGLPQNNAAAVQRVEAAMKLGIPAAYDRMGTMYQNGIGVRADATRAYAFYQKAAEMGSPESQTYLGAKLMTSKDEPNRGQWANIPIGMKMMECAFAQGYGNAAYRLGLASRFFSKDKEQALRYFHEGVKMGSDDSAGYLSSEFGSPDLFNTINPVGVDPARAERYRIFNRALRRNPLLRFPNLDAVLPLPPARIPSWNGNEDDLLNAAKGVLIGPKPPVPPPSSQREGRYHLDTAYTLTLSPRPDTTSSHARYEGYWQPVSASHPELTEIVKKIPPGFYQKDEKFEQFINPYHYKDNGKLANHPIYGVTWQRWDVVEIPAPYVDPRVRTGLLRQVAYLDRTVMCTDELACPITGVWAPRIAEQIQNHPLRPLVNQPWRQAWLEKGQPFPQPQQDWLLDVSTQQVEWVLLDKDGVDFS